MTYSYQSENVTAIVTSSFEITDTGLIVHGNPTFAEWLAFGEKLSHQYSRIQWAIGDWINEGENRYGEMYAQALDQTNYAYGTLRNYASVCARIPKHVRNPKLRFHQQKHVAPLMVEEQQRVLDFAAEKNLTGDDVHDVVAKTLGRPTGQRTENGHETDAKKLLDTSAVVYRTYSQDDGDYLILRLPRGCNTVNYSASRFVRLVIMEAQS